MRRCFQVQVLSNSTSCIAGGNTRAFCARALCADIISRFGCQAPVMRPDGAFLNSTSSLIRHSSHLPVRHDLQNLSAQESAYALEIGHPYLRGMPAPRVLPTTTMDPSRLQHRPSPMLATQEDSSSESDVEMVNGGGCDHGLGRPLDADDAAGWTHHPDTIGVGIPDFQETKIKGDMRDTAGVQVPVVMHARFVLKKKAARQENCWILYRRNYFGIQGSYSLEGSPDSSSNETLYLYIHNHQPKPIQALFMCMRGVVDTEEGAEIRIVVFNPKRKPVHEGTETPPIEPQRMKPLTEGTTKFYAESTGDRQDHMKVPMNHTFPRNQFRAATQNNGARRTEQQFYHILLELKAEVIVDGVPKMFTISSKMSEALVVRGRCPLSFKDKDKDGPIRDSNRKGGRKSARDRSGLGSRRGSTLQSHREGQTKGPSRGICNKTGNSSRRSTRASSNLPSLIHGTGSRSANTNPVSPLSALSTDGIVNRETIPRLDHELLTLRRECWDGDPPWLDGHDTS